MIPINFITKDEEYKRGVVDFFYKKIVKNSNLNYIKKIDTWCKSNLNISNRIFSFEDVIKATPPEILLIKSHIEQNKISMSSFYKPSRSGNKYCYIIDNLYKNKVPRLFFVDSLNVTVCPYCNRNFVNSSEDQTLCQLDHFINKNEFPILAVSFYNLIPVCSSCNHKKGKQDFSFSPHDLELITNNLIRFSYHISGCDYLFDYKQLYIDLDYSNQIAANVEGLHLEEIYQIHTDLVQELIKKAYIYNELYIQDILHNYSYLFDSQEELERVLFGNYLTESNFAKRPLAKLTYDICKELGAV